MSTILKAIKLRQKNQVMYLASVDINDLERFSIDIWDPKNVIRKRGYQRNPDEKRIKKIAKFFIRKDAIMPVAGLANIREKDRVKYSNGKLTVPDGIKIWVVDMQHRMKGIIEAKELGYLKNAQFNFPVVITEGLNQINEAAQFYVINTKSKKMGVDLTRRLLIENDAIKDIADVKEWEIIAVRVTIELNKAFRNNPWYGAILEPNSERSLPHIATEKSFVPSLRQLLISGNYKQYKKVAKRLANFWLAIKENLPEAFEEPKKYLIQKTPGIFAFNFFIAPIILSKYKDKSFTKALSGLKLLEDDFWKGKNKKGAKRFGTGMGGYSNLAEYIKSKL